MGTKLGRESGKGMNKVLFILLFIFKPRDGARIGVRRSVGLGVG